MESAGCLQAYYSITVNSVFESLHSISLCKHTETGVFELHSVYYGSMWNMWKNLGVSLHCRLMSVPSRLGGPVLKEKWLRIILLCPMPLVKISQKDMFHFCMNMSAIVHAYIHELIKTWQSIAEFERRFLPRLAGL